MGRTERRKNDVWVVFTYVDMLGPARFGRIGPWGGWPRARVRGSFGVRQDGETWSEALARRGTVLLLVFQRGMGLALVGMVAGMTGAPGAHADDE